MPLFTALPIMPKETKTPMQYHHGPTPASSAPYPSTSNNFASGQRNAAIWTTADDEILLQARASTLNWQSIASRHFPNKTANACRKRHERLIERRHVEDWDSHKLELLAQEYLTMRKEMWGMLAERVGERWQVVEAKCMEKGLKTLQATTRMATRKGSVVSNSHQSAQSSSRGISPYHSDSGIGLCSDTEMEAAAVEGLGHMKSASWDSQVSNAHSHNHYRHHHEEHVRARSLPQQPLPLPLYRPPPPVTVQGRRFGVEERVGMTTSPDDMHFEATAAAAGRPRMGLPQQQCYSPSMEEKGRAGISIQSVLAPTEGQRA